MSTLRNILRSRRIQFFLRFVAVFFTFCILWRLTFFVAFFEGETASSLSDLIKAALVGIQFDSRLVMFAFSPLLMITLFPYINIVRHRFVAAIARVYIWMLSISLLCVYVFDFGYFEYLNRRIDVTILNFFSNPDIALDMMKESYPIVWILVGISVYIYITKKSIDWIMNRTQKQSHVFTWKHKTPTIIFFAVIYIWAAWQSFSQYPLRWSKAYFTNNVYTSSLALNPVLFFYDTYAFLDKEYDVDTAKKYYPWVKDYFDISDNEPPLSYDRHVATKKGQKKPHIVIVFLETFPASHLKIMGNPLHPAPYLDSLVEKSIFFNRFYVPAYGTARSVFGLITGIPDVSRADTSSRNPFITKQNTLINAFKGYEKYYMIGGSASWANIRGLITHNIPGLHLLEQEAFDAPSIDVWGISDYDLLDQSSDVFYKRKSTKPVFAIIQTATNHSPYTIPSHIKGFKKAENITVDALNKAGFNRKKQELDQYNAVKLLDYSVENFMKKMEEQGMVENTIFCFFGDHGTYGTPEHMGPIYTNLGLYSFHVPMFIYAPGFIKEGKVINDVGTLPDILATLAGMAGMANTNKTLGRDLLTQDKQKRKENKALLINFNKAKTEISVIGHDFVMSMYRDGSNTKLYQLNDTQKETQDVKNKYPEVATVYKQAGLSLYETAKYMLHHPD